MPESSHLPSTAPRSTSRRIFGWIALGAVVIGGAVAVWWWLRETGPEASYIRGRHALIRGDREVVIRESDHLLKTPGYEPQGALLKGLLLVRIQKLGEAIPWLEKASSRESLAVEASTAAARCFYLTGRYLEAIDAAHVALEQDATCLDARRWLAAAYYDLGAVSHAIAELERISIEAPGDARADRLLGLIAKDGEQYIRAIGHYSESLRRDEQQPDRESILLELAEAQIKSGRFQDALVTLKDCRRSAAALTWEAECRSNLGENAEAHTRLREALELDRRYFPARLAQGKLFLDTGETDEAIKALEEAIQLQPQSSQAHFQLSQALRRSGKVDQADIELRRMGEIQALEREFTDLHEEAAQKPNDAEIRFRTGELAMKLGKPKLAGVWFRAALAINPNHARARAALNQQPPVSSGT